MSSEHFDDLSVIGEKPTNKARVKALMSLILETKAQGYNLVQIYHWLSNNDKLDCSLRTFRKHYYEFRKFDTEPSSVGSTSSVSPSMPSPVEHATSRVPKSDRAQELLSQAQILSEPDSSAGSSLSLKERIKRDMEEQDRIAEAIFAKHRPKPLKNPNV